MSEWLFPTRANWEHTTLGEICRRGGGEVQTGPFGSQLHAADYVPFGIPSIMPQNIGDNRINEEGIARITPEDAQRLSRYLVREGDIVYSRRGDVERRALVRQHEDGWLCGTGCLRVSFGKGVVHPSYAAFYLGHPSVREWIVRHAHGATMPNLNTSILSALPFVLPPFVDQRAIARILGDLDDKIELNRQINQTLEQIAQTIFKSWFVDFEPVKAKIEAKAAGRDPERAAMCAISGKLEAELDQLPPEQFQQLAATAELFPDEFVESELGLIPVGWEVVTLDSLSSKVSKGTTPTRQDIGSADDEPKIPFIKVKDIGDDGELNRDGIEIIPDSVHRGALKRSILNTNDILFSIAGTIGRIAVVEKNLHNSNTNQAVAFVRLKNSDAHLGLCLQHLKSQRLQDAANAAIVQGVQANLSLGNLGNFQILLPCEEVLVAWNDKYRALFEESRCIAGGTRTLATLRDTLLPKLLSGELRPPSIPPIS